MSFFQTTEFYVILFLVAMAIVGFIAIPHHAGPVTEHLIGSTLSSSTDSTPSTSSTSSTPSTPSTDFSDFSDSSDLNPRTRLIASLPQAPAIVIDCDESGAVWLRRTGLRGVDATGAVSAKVAVKGFNITVSERVVAGRYGDSPVDTALFELDFLGSERYYLRYEADAENRAATLAFRNIPGYHAEAPLKQ